MGKKYCVSVTKEDIKDARGVNNCPMIRAIRRKFNDKDANFGYCQGWAGDVRIKACNTNLTEKFAIDFDAGKKVKPFKFYVKEV